MNDPQLASHNLQRATEAKGGEFLFNREIVAVRRNGRVEGVTLENRARRSTPLSSSTSPGPHSFVINRMADVEKTMNIKTRALRHEVHIVPAPRRVDYEHAGFTRPTATRGSTSAPRPGTTSWSGARIRSATRRSGSTSPTSFDREVTKAQ